MNSDDIAFWSMVIAVISAVFTGVGIVVAVWANRKAAAAAEEANALERTIVNIEKQRHAERKEEKKKARLAMHIEPEIHPSGAMQNLLIVENKGQCSARNLKFEIRSIKDQAESKSGESKILAPDSILMQRFAFNSSGPFEVTAIWDDDFEELREIKHSLTLDLK